MLRRAIEQGEMHGEMVGEDGVATLYASTRARRTPWVITATLPVPGAAQSAGSQTLLAGLTALAAAILVACLLASRITRPLSVLHRAAESIGGGDLAHRVPELSGESGIVGRAFNAMAERIERQQRDLAESEEWLRAVFRQGPLAAILVSLETRQMLEVNDVFVTMTGYSPEELIDRTTLEAGLWADPESRERLYRALSTDRRVEALEARIRTRSGEMRDVLLYGEIVLRHGCKVLLVQAVDLTERKFAERQLREVSKRLQLATRAARIGIWDLDIRSQRMVWDDTMFELFGVAPRDFLGRFEDWSGLLHPDDRAETERIAAEAMAGRGRFDVDFRIVRPDASVRHIRAKAFVERDDRGAPIRMVGSHRDVTEQVLGRAMLSRINTELESRVAERTDRLQETVRELEAFSYTVAHDLRAPLRAIDGFSSYLAEELRCGASDESKALIGKIRRNVAGMDSLIDGLLTYARLGRQSFKRVPVDMEKLVHEVWAQIADAWPGVSADIGSLPGTQGDPELLRQVWANLLGNACKFSSGSPTPRVEVGSTRDAEGTMFFVRDNGVGFDMRFADKLFRVFERLHDDHQFSGTGVGLAIVQRVVQRHGGVAWAHGATGQGATFHFRLPESDVRAD